MKNKLKSTKSSAFSIYTEYVSAIIVADMQHGYIVGIAMMLPTHEFVQIISEHVLVYPFQGSCNIRVPYERD